MKDIKIKFKLAPSDAIPASRASQLARRPLRVTRKLTLTEAATGALREMFDQFTAHLTLLRTSDDPEVVHQARVVWRRFKSTVRLFKPVLNADTRPSWQPLQGLLTLLGELRELDVASTETLPALEHAFTAGNARRAGHWQAMTQALDEAQASKRQVVRQALLEPVVGDAFRDITQWLEGNSAVNAPSAKTAGQQIAPHRWARRRLARLREQLKLALKAPATTESQHQTRIAAKRQRYAIETLRPLLPKRRAKRWYKQAVTLQNSLGAQRDVVRAGELVGQLQADRGLVEFLRGVAVGQSE